MTRTGIDHRHSRFASLAGWTLRLARARAFTTVRTRTRPLDSALAAVRDGPAVLPGEEAALLVQIEQITDFWLRRIPLTRTSCLPRALARYMLLREAGVPVQLVLGIRDAPGDVVGHAWIELRGLPIMERERSAYTETFRYGASR